VKWLPFMLVFATAVAQAQTPPPMVADEATCRTLDLTPGALLYTPAAGLATPIPWSDLVIEGEQLSGDSPATVRALLEPSLAPLRTTLSEDKWPEVAAVTAKFGYQLVDHAIRDTHLVLKLAPLPVVHKVEVDVEQGWWAAVKAVFKKLIGEEVRRRMRLRTGSYLPFDPVRRQCVLNEERRRILDYLHDEGFWDAKVRFDSPSAKHGEVNLHVAFTPGDEYKTGRITITRAPTSDPTKQEPLAIAQGDIRDVFEHPPRCIVGPLCLSTGRFTRAQHLEDLQKVRDMFHRRGYPAVRIQSTWEELKDSKRVNITVTIDQRRQVLVEFRGHDPDAVSNEALRKQVTFDQAGSADDVEAGLSAVALTAFLQRRGYFDAHVTWSREKFDAGATGFDRVTFWIDLGRPRTVSEIGFTGHHAFTVDQLADVVATKKPEQTVATTLFGQNSAATSEQLANDVERIKEFYRRAGYRDARVSVAASVTEDGVGHAALTAPLVEAGLGNDLRVRFEIEEGEPTLLTRIELIDNDTAGVVPADLCRQALAELASEIGGGDKIRRAAALPLSRPAGTTGCAGVAPRVLLREDEVRATRDAFRDWMFTQARPRSEIQLELCAEASPPGECVRLGPTDHRAIARYQVRAIAPVTIGKVVIRGNFRTSDSVIQSELERAGLSEGSPLKTAALADGGRYLRNTGLFNAVNIDMPDLATNTSPVVNAVVRVEERYDYFSEIRLEGGYSSYNEGLFGTLQWLQPNLFGRGISFLASGTYGSKIKSAEGTLRIPQFLLPRHAFDLELTGLYREQDTARFGLLKTTGASVGLTRRWSSPRRSESEPAHSAGITVHYDFRQRNRNVFALRPIGVENDNSQVAIETTTGSVGVTGDIERRVDLDGNPAPLAPQAGYRLEASLAVAHPVFSFNIGSDTFIKVSASASKFYSPRSNVVLRGDLRLDEGFPLGGAVLLPEVERYFAGGDGTVRGYDDDKLATEIVQVGVPPLSNVSQIRVSPAGGNIRVIGSLDAQVRIWSVFAGAVFTDAGMITNQWSTVTADDIRPSVGTGLRVVSAFGIGAFEYAVPLRVHLGDDPRGRWHVYFAARAQF
jgi:outer membrane protein assembly factor BamA